MDSLKALRAAVSDGQDGFETLDKPGGVPAKLEDALVLRISSDGSEFELSSATAFESATLDPPHIDLRTVVNCWQCRGMSVTEYISTSDERGIPNLQFLERTDLVEWLDGSSATSEYIKDASGGEDEGASAQYDVDMVDAPSSVERGTLVDHNSVLHGQKLVDFSNVATLSHKSIIHEFRNASAGGAPRPQPSLRSAASSTMVPLKPTKGKDPIILLSPSPSSMLNMANVQDFLEKGTFSPVLKSSTSPNLLRITHNSKVIGSKVRFVVVDSVSQFKPEYWDRVVAVFVTGQSWQLKQYKWPDANSLFQHVLGFALVYKNDPVPEQLKQWNVKVETLDRTARFRDREVIERIWERIEAHMISRGWPVVHAS